MKQLEKSPVNNNLLRAYISCKDYTVSHETFSILKDETSELLVTSPRPNDKDLTKYYESETYISHTDAKKSAFDRIYHLVRNYTLKRKIKLINSLHVSQRTMLDIGAGTGDFLLVAKNNEWNVEGVEPSEMARRIADEKLNQKLNVDISELEGQSFDIITMWHVLEHVPNVMEYIVQLKNLLKEDGVLIVAVPNHKSFDAKYYGVYWAAYDVPRHLWHFSQKSIAEIFGKEKMKIIKTLPMKFDAFYVSLLSEKYKRGNMNPIKAFYIGWRSNMKAKKSGEYSSLIYVIKKEE